MKTPTTVFLFSMIMSSLCFAQALQPEDTIKRLHLSPDDMDAIFKIVNSGRPDSYEILKDAFDRSAKIESKLRIASGILRVKPDDSEHYSWMEGLMSKSLAEEGPSPYVAEAAGKQVARAISPQFEKWCQQKQRNLRDCLLKYTTEDPSTMLSLAKLRDERAVHVLLLGVRSANISVATFAVAGLGLLGKEESLALILSNITQRPKEEASAIAMGLVRFQSPQARALFEQYWKLPGAFETLEADFLKLPKSVSAK